MDAGGTGSECSAARLSCGADGSRRRALAESAASVRVLSPPVDGKFRPDFGPGSPIGRFAEVAEGPRQVAARQPSGRRRGAHPKRGPEIGLAVRIARVGRVFPRFAPFARVSGSPGHVGDVAATFADPGAEPGAAVSAGSRSNAVHRRACIKQKVAPSERLRARCVCPSSSCRTGGRRRGGDRPRGGAETPPRRRRGWSDEAMSRAEQPEKRSAVRSASEEQHSDQPAGRAGRAGHHKAHHGDRDPDRPDDAPRGFSVAIFGPE